MVYGLETFLVLPKQLHSFYTLEQLKQLRIQKLEIDDEAFVRYLFEKYEMYPQDVKEVENPLSEEDLDQELTEIDNLKEEIDEFLKRIQGMGQEE